MSIPLCQGLTMPPAVYASAGAIFCSSILPYRSASSTLVALHGHRYNRAGIVKCTSTIMAAVDHQPPRHVADIGQRVLDRGIRSRRESVVVDVAREQILADVGIVGPLADEDDAIIRHEQLKGRGLVQIALVIDGDLRQVLGRQDAVDLVGARYTAAELIALAPQVGAIGVLEKGIGRG